MAKCTSRAAEIASIILEMDTKQAIAVWDLVGAMNHEETERYISLDGHNSLCALWRELDKELIRLELVS